MSTSDEQQALPAGHYVWTRNSPNWREIPAKVADIYSDDLLEGEKVLHIEIPNRSSHEHE